MSACTMTHRSLQGPRRFTFARSKASSGPVLTALLALSLLAAQGRGQTMDLPARPADAPTGSELGAILTDLSLEAREARVLQEVRAGNIPTWLRSLVEIRLPLQSGEVLSIWATPDYLALGSDDDALRIPLSPRTAQQVADLLGMALPTPLVVDRLWEAAVVKLDPRPIEPSPEMTTVPVFIQHNAMVADQLQVRGAEPGRLVAGHKKDVVVCLGLQEAQGKVAIYGWHRRDGHPIQPLYLGHSDRWVDYSHGIRLVSRVVRVHGESRDWHEALRDEELVVALSGEGLLRNARYPSPVR